MKKNLNECVCQSESAVCPLSNSIPCWFMRASLPELTRDRRVFLTGPIFPTKEEEEKEENKIDEIKNGSRTTKSNEEEADKNGHEWE